MWRKVHYNYKKKGLIIGGGLLFFASYTLAFRKTFESIRLNYELEDKRQVSNDLSSNPEYISRKLVLLNNLLQRYQVDSIEYKNDFWLRLSEAASAKGLRVIYKPKDVLTSDSTILKQSIQFQGSYKQLIKLLDTVENMKNIGCITSLSIIREKDFGLTKKVEVAMLTNFGAVKNHNYCK